MFYGDKLHKWQWQCGLNCGSAENLSCKSTKRKLKLKPIAVLFFWEQSISNEGTTGNNTGKLKVQITKQEHTDMTYVCPISVFCSLQT